MISGIYCYKDSLNNDEIVYVGKDSYIETNTRHYNHHCPSRYDKQVINRVLQNNPNRYKYSVLKKGEFDESLLSALEVIYVQRYSPKFNFTKGGDGCLGYKHTPETREKIRKSKLGENNPLYGKSPSKETRKKSSLSISNSTNSSGYYRVCKHKSPEHKQGFTWLYRYMDDSGVRRGISRVNLDDLKEEVIARGLEWREL